MQQTVSYLGCAEHKRSGCRGRATIPVGGSLNMLKMTQPHNHPPDVNAEEKDAFVRELKNAVRSHSMEKVTLKKVYETVAEVYMRCCKYQSLGCRGRVILNLDTPNRVVFTQPHNHPKVSIFDKRSEEFSAQLKFACMSGINLPIKTIYDDLARVYPEVAKTKPFNSVECKPKRKRNMPRYIVDGFVFHVNITKGKPRMIYLRCMEYKRLGCHARAVIPSEGSIHDIRLNTPHNHPPDFAAEEKIIFMRIFKFIRNSLTGDLLITQDQVYKFVQMVKDKKLWKCYKSTCTAKCYTNDGKVVLRMGVIYFDRAHKYPKLIMNYYEYTIERTSFERTSWCCGLKKKLKCKARLVTFGSTVKVMNDNHTHEPKYYTIRDHVVSQVVNIIKHYYKWY
ncbi:FLYWCH domain containing protein [Asbolus verrucosus]|uniref:FLYWCH domain containing protein n=1 Tax=Asbolus verrucosus TaxID=1661398 RepID=A0A482VYW5_ASBVE|nr:FLYWCH domain containing protein [Asbolus verrucosus]